MQMKKTTHILLWIAQILLSLCLSWAGIVKLFQPVEQLKMMWPWTGEVSQVFVKLIGIIDLLGALGLLIPPLFRFKPVLTPIAAIGIISSKCKLLLYTIARHRFRPSRNLHCEIQITLLPSGQRSAKYSSVHQTPN